LALVAQVVLVELRKMEMMEPQAVLLHLLQPLQAVERAVEAERI
jgi:hypothetical protein